MHDPTHENLLDPLDKIREAVEGLRQVDSCEEYDAASIHLRAACDCLRNRQSRAELEAANSPSETPPTEGSETSSEGAGQSAPGEGTDPVNATPPPA